MTLIMNIKVLKTLEFDKIITRLETFAVSEGAKAEARALVPSSGLAAVKSAVTQTTDAVNMILRCTQPPFSEIRDVAPHLMRAEIGSALSIRELLDVARVMKSARLLKSYKNNDKSEEMTSISSLFSMLTADKEFEEMLLGNLLAEDEVADSASVELARIRRAMRKSADTVKNILNDFVRSAKFQKYLQETIITMRGDRYVLPVKAEHKGDVAGIVHDTSASGATLFIEPISVVTENNRLRELEGAEQDEILRILLEYTENTRQRRDIISQNYNIITELDFIFAKAKLSLDMNGHEPNISDNGAIDLKDARHPLLDKKTVVPINVTLGGDFDALIITGPNTGGKTVVLKTAGLLTLMVQAGLHIPVSSGSNIRVYENVFADIGDEQSIEQSLSTFSSHMKNIIDILNNVNDASLALFDELGAGTDPVEGAALAISIIENVRSRGAQLAATTHYSELKLYALTTAGVKNASCEFDVETLKPTYRLLIGIPGKSNAFAISKKLGLDEGIISAAAERLSEDKVKFEDVISELEKKREAVNSEHEEAVRVLSDAEQIKKSLKNEQDAMLNKSDEIVEKAKAEAQRILSEAKIKADGILEEVNDIRKNANEAGVQKRIVEVKTKLNRDIEETKVIKRPQNRRSIRAEEIKIGSTVEVIKLGTPAAVLSLPDSDGKLTVMAGVMKMTVNLRDIAKTDEKKADDPMIYIKNTGASLKTREAKTEIDLRGLMLEDALEQAEKFIDDATLLSLKQITVIHGKGTGVLRAGIHKMLKDDRRVKEFRLGRYGEGETGVTVITLH